MEDGLSFFQDDGEELHLVGLLLGVELAFKTCQSLVEDVSLLTESFEEILGLRVVLLDALHVLEGLVDVDLETLDLLLVHLDFFFDGLLSSFKPCDEDR